MAIVAPIFENPDIAKIGHNLKYDAMMLKQEGVVTKGRLYDTMLTSYLINRINPITALRMLALSIFPEGKRHLQRF